MSDPVSNSEIEDVLASIRRLVSENAKALKRERDPESEKLVLTPAFRVDESETPDAARDVFAADREVWTDASEALVPSETVTAFPDGQGSPGSGAGLSGDQTAPETAAPEADAPDATADEMSIAAAIEAELAAAGHGNAVAEDAPGGATQATPGPDVPATPGPDVQTTPGPDAKPQSWIEGLVAAAASAESARLAARAAPPAPPATGPAEEAAPSGAGPDETPQDQAAETGPEPDRAGEDATATAGEDVPQTGAEPVQSWVDRLIAAAAALHADPAQTPEVPAAAEAEPVETKEAGTSGRAADGPEAREGEAEASGGDAAAPLSLESPVGPESAGQDTDQVAEKEARVLEWEPAEVPDETLDGEADAQAHDGETRDAQAPDGEADAQSPDGETRDAQASDAQASDAQSHDGEPAEVPDEAPDREAGAALTGVPVAPPAQDGDPADAHPEDTADIPQDAPAAVLEWEPVEILEADADLEALAEAEEAELARIDEAGATAPGEATSDPAETLASSSEVVDFRASQSQEASSPEAVWEPVDPITEAVAQVVGAAEGPARTEADAPAGNAQDHHRPDPESPAPPEADAAGRDDAGADQQTAAADEQPPAGVAPLHPETGAALPPEDETVVDEAMLREMVAQLVRDELQGTVGERITHNVRRLIRREIARALTLQDFENR
ncbi:MAG: hypothetical protein CSA74_00345 [Rhodobacterales bacterium]|nr:MAG: hypothetical protein CSA74_00345 [Rhodobacterales bacterium]